MIDYLEGKVIACTDKSATIMVGGIGFSLTSPDTSGLIKDQTARLFTYMHWNQDKGPSLYGFSSEIDRSIFLLIIDCPKIGPAIGISILSQISSAQFIEAVTSQNDKALSAINGIGAKKAEQIIAHLRHKVAKLISTGKLQPEEQQDFTHWQSVSEVLGSLNYSRQEVSKTLSYLTEKYAGQNASLDQLIRSGLAYLSKGMQ